MTSKRHQKTAHGNTAVMADMKFPPLAKPVPFRLIANDNGASPVVRMRVCLSTELVSKLKEELISMPFLLIVHGPWDKAKECFKHDKGGSSIERRQLFPLDRGIVQLTFDRPGQHKVFATVVWADCQSDKVGVQQARLTEAYCYRRPGWWNYQLVDVHGEAIVDSRGNSLGYTDVHVITVDANLFAPEPRPWIKWWATRVFGQPADDQCNWWRRTLFAFTLQPFVMLAWMIIKWGIGGLFCFAVAVLLTKRLHPSVLLRPYSGGLNEFAPFMFDASWNGDSREDWLEMRRTGPGNEWSDFKDLSGNVQYWLKPWRMLLLFGVGWAVSAALMKWTDIEFSSPATVYGSWFAVAATLIAMLATWLYERNENILDSNKSHLSEAQVAQLRHDLESKRQQQLREFYDTRLTPLVATDKVPGTHVDDLPVQHRTIALRVEQHKAGSCKPFAKG